MKKVADTVMVPEFVPKQGVKIESDPKAEEKAQQVRDANNKVGKTGKRPDKGEPSKAGPSKAVSDEGGDDSDIEVLWEGE